LTVEKNLNAIVGMNDVERQAAATAKAAQS